MNFPTQPNGTRFCGRCGCPREQSVGRCPECKDAEFSLNPTITYKGWLRRNGKVKTTKIIVSGDDDFEDWKFFKKKLDKLTQDLQDIEIITRGNKGTSQLAIRWGYENECVLINYHPDKQKHGKRAVLAANAEMVKECGAKFAVICWDESNQSTFDLICQTKKVGIPTRILRYEE